MLPGETLWLALAVLAAADRFEARDDCDDDRDDRNDHNERRRDEPLRGGVLPSYQAREEESDGRSSATGVGKPGAGSPNVTRLSLDRPGARVTQRVSVELPEEGGRPWTGQRQQAGNGGHFVEESSEGTRPDATANVSEILYLFYVVFFFSTFRTGGRFEVLDVVPSS